MSENQSGMAQIEPLMTLDLQTRLVRTVSATPLGERTVFDIVGGSFRGRRLSGRVPASGGDWLIRTPKRSQLDVRMLLETEDGATLLLRYSGKASQRAAAPRIEVIASFEAPEGPHDWLNDVQAFGLGSPTADGVRYQLYHFK